MRAEVDAPALLDRLGIAFRRRGRSLVAPCPFPGHVEREPSWSIVDAPGDDRSGLSHCFGCGRGGTPADLVAAVLGIDVRAARDWLRSGAVLRDRDLPSQVVVRVLRQAAPFTLPAGVAFAPLPDMPTPARDYLARRGVTEAQAARWGLGHATSGRLAMRVVVPVRDGSGVLRSFVARSFVARTGTREARRYLEPDEEDRADHATILGEHLWPRAGRRLAIAAEGWFDVAAMERAAAMLGVPAAPAALHGSPHPSQAGWDAAIGKLATFPDLLVAVDPNAAGERLFDSLAGSLARYSRVTALRIFGFDAAGLAEARGDAALARAMAPLIDVDQAAAA